MDNLEKALSILFRRVSAQDIIIKTDKSLTIDCNEFVQMMRSYSDRYSDTELRLMYRTFVLKINERKNYNANTTEIDVFELLSIYASWILTVQDDEITIPYLKMFHWRNITFELDEDILSTCFLASARIDPTTLRGMYAWKSTLTHNNRELHRILDKGITENHSHLKGAATLFPLTWISIVNMPAAWAQYQQDIDEIDSKKRSVNKNYKVGFKEAPLVAQIIQAAAIRLLLVSYLRKAILTENQRMKLKEIILADPDKEIRLRQDELNIIIRKVRLLPNFLWLENKEISDEDWLEAGETAEGEETTQVDYAAKGLKGTEEVFSKSSMQESPELYGERWFLYSMFNKLLADQKDQDIYDNRHLFYAYLVIKENFRAELVQINSSVGFENFSAYEKRKDIFFENQPFFMRKQVENAIREGIFESNVITYEARIAPKDDRSKMVDIIKKLDERIDSENHFKNRYYYTIHFIKETEDDYKKYYEEALNARNADRITGEGEGCISLTACRHVILREKCRKMAEALVEIRNYEPEIAKRIRGIDAANMEIGCGPEVFAQVFRYLGDHSTHHDKGEKIPQLRKTYHVGEDYLDMISGLRAIDEALHFLDMSCGDRLGHAMALGRDVDEWYVSKGNRVLLPMQEYLDNLAWLHHQLIVNPDMRRVHLEDYIRKEYEYYFQIIYGRYINYSKVRTILDEARDKYISTEYASYYYEIPRQFDIETYYAAWKLRGDNPACYQRGYFDNHFAKQTTDRTFEFYNINNRATKRPSKRYITNISLLYYYYHFNEDVRREGAKPVEVIIPKAYIECVKYVQKILQKKIASAGICIETNPSSNFKISNLGMYQKHPIFTFYNRQLVDTDQELAECPQINVSVNTDDAGIFATSLENEYAYLALALEKAKKPDGRPKYKRENIYAWINDVREMGLRQTFLDDASMKVAIREWNHQHEDNKEEKSAKPVSLVD